MKKYIVETIPVDFKEGDVWGFDKDAILVKVMKARNDHKENEIYTITTTLTRSQLLSLKGVERIRILF